ncbi:hypothetical protein ACSRMP_003770 [Acinetobacter baumannii]|nr:hypothetical protein [Acinetobacter baumannii]
MEGIHLLYLEINKIFSLSCQPICNSANKFSELREIEYDDVPRGRVIFDKNKNKLIIYLDKKLLIKGKVSKICDFFDAEYDVNTVLRLDPHYRT